MTTFDGSVKVCVHVVSVIDVVVLVIVVEVMVSDVLVVVVVNVVVDGRVVGGTVVTLSALLRPSHSKDKMCRSIL